MRCTEEQAIEMIEKMLERFKDPALRAKIAAEADAAMAARFGGPQGVYMPATRRELTDVMKEEYDAIVRAGFVLQVDCPDLAMSRHLAFAERSTAEFLRIAEGNVEALNHALRDVPPDRVRLHLCWGNYEGPHTHDVPLEAVLPIVCRARVGALSLPLANPRHQHEYRVLKRLRLPDSMLLLPGVIDTTTNYVEHPEVVADRIIAATRPRLVAVRGPAWPELSTAAAIGGPELLDERVAQLEGAEPPPRPLAPGSIAITVVALAVLVAGLLGSIVSLGGPDAVMREAMGGDGSDMDMGGMGLIGLWPWLVAAVAAVAAGWVVRHIRRPVA